MNIKETDVIRYKAGSYGEVKDNIIREEWLELFINGTHVYSTPMLDQDIDDLIKGLLIVMTDWTPEIRYKTEKQGSAVYLETDKKLKFIPIRKQAERFLDQEENISRLNVSAGTWSAEDILGIMKDFQKLPSAYHLTGGVHMAAFYSGELICWADDISRRNSVDKVIGRLAALNFPFKDGILVSSGRISSDIAARMILTGIPVIASVSAPMDKAVDLADKYGITICGFVRGKRMNVYSNPERIIFREES